MTAVDRWVRRLTSLSFALVFWPMVAAISAATAGARATRWGERLRRRRPARGEASILYLPAFYPEGAGYKYRVAKWAEILRRRGVTVDARHVLGRRWWERLVRPPLLPLFHLAYLVSRVAHCLAATSYACVVVTRELLPYDDYGGPFLERFLLSLHGNVILDFDDDLAAAKDERREVGAYGRLLRERPTKFSETLRLYSRFMPGSRYLASRLAAARGGAPADVLVVPTCVDYPDGPRKSYGSADAPLLLGWVGSDNNRPYLESILPALAALARRHPLRLLVVSGSPFSTTLDLEVESVLWDIDAEVENLLRIDVGLMPLFDTPVERGKCGFKLIQYMGCGLVSVASAVTTNAEIVDHGRNGFLVAPGADWEQALADVLAERRRFGEIGTAAAQTVAARYSFRAFADPYHAFCLGRRDD